MVKILHILKQFLSRYSFFLYRNEKRLQFEPRSEEADETIDENEACDGHHEKDDDHVGLCRDECEENAMIEVGPNGGRRQDKSGDLNQ